jgi:hypothetical protein
VANFSRRKAAPTFLIAITAPSVREWSNAIHSKPPLAHARSYQPTQRYIPNTFIAPPQTPDQNLRVCRPSSFAATC